MKKTLFACAGLLLSVIASGTALADQLSDIVSRGVIRIAVPNDFPPFGSAGPDLQPQGYDIDMAKLIAKKLNVKLQMTPVTTANRIPYLQTNKVDLVISMLGKNAERERVIDFSRIYAPYDLGVYGPDATDIHDAAKLSGQTVGVSRGGLEDLSLTAIAPKDAIIKRYEDNNTTIAAYLSGQVQYISTGNFTAAVIAAQHPSKAPATKFLLKKSGCYVGMNKNEDQLKAKVNSIVQGAFDDGTLNNISEKWLKAPLPKDFGA